MVSITTEYQLPNKILYNWLAVSTPYWVMYALYKHPLCWTCIQNLFENFVTFLQRYATCILLKPIQCFLLLIYIYVCAYVFSSEKCVDSGL